MIEKGATDLNRGLDGACRGGRMELAQLMIQRGATNWDLGLREAIRRNHFHVIEYLKNLTIS
jgi:hypothetical protein